MTAAAGLAVAIFPVGAGATAAGARTADGTGQAAGTAPAAETQARLAG